MPKTKTLKRARTKPKARAVPHLSAPEIIKLLEPHYGPYVIHRRFWDVTTPGGSDAPSGDLAAAIDGAFGALDDFKAKLESTAGAQFGSGWGWLCVDAQGDLSVISTANQDSPHMQGLTPLLGVDVWEHAYYLNYQNRRPDYLAAFWNVVNWDVVGRRHTEATGG